MFSGAAKRAVEASGYPAIAPGPRRLTKPYIADHEKMAGKAYAAQRRARDQAARRRVGNRIALSDRRYGARRLWPARLCGLDCLSNKG